MLDEHFLNGFKVNIRIQRSLAEGAKIIKGRDEFGVGLAFLLDERFQVRANLRNLVFEFLRGLIPFHNNGRREFQEPGQGVNEFLRLGQVGFIKPFTVLIKHGGGRVARTGCFPWDSRRQTCV